MKPVLVLTVLIICLLWLPNLFVWWLKTRNIETITAVTEIPTDVKNYYDNKTFAEAKSNVLKMNWTEIIINFFHDFYVSVLIVTGFAALVWRRMNRLNERYNYDKDFVLPALWIICLAMPYLITYVILHLFNAIFQGSAEALSHGVALCITVTFGFLVDLIIIYILVKYGGKSVFIYLGIFTMIMVLVFSWLFSLIQADILPTRNLTDTNLEIGIQDLTKRMGIPSDRIYFQNDNVTGAFNTGFFGSQIIVITDGFLKCSACKNNNCSRISVPCPGDGKDGSVVVVDGITYKRRYTNKEILSVLAHEGTHWIEHHPVILLLLNEIIILSLAVLCHFAYVSEYICRVFCIPDQTCKDLMKFKLVVVLIEIPCMSIMTIITTMSVRQCEYRADYNVKVLGFGNDLISCLSKLHADNLAFPLCDSLYSFFLLDHPTLIERIDALK